MVNISDECLIFYIFRLRTMTESTWKIWKLDWKTRTEFVSSKRVGTLLPLGFAVECVQCRLQLLFEKLWDKITYLFLVLWQCLLDSSESIWPVNIEWCGACMGISLDWGVHMVQLMPLPPHHVILHENPEWFIFLVPAYPDCPGK